MPISLFRTTHFRTTHSSTTRLTCDGRDVASLEIADTFTSRLKGLLGRSEPAGALLITKTSSVHTFGMRFAVDVAFCDQDLKVIDILTMSQHRLSRRRSGAVHVVEALAGSFQCWNLRRGSVLEAQK